jgi:tetratricopeptide (TPR) repeat protein
LPSFRLNWTRVCPICPVLKLKKLVLHILPLLLLVLGLTQCATNKNNWRTRGFHRLNTRFNGYYYAREAIKDGLLKIDKANIDDYSQIIPLFVYPNKESQKMASGDMEKAIKKCTSAIERHMITDKKNVEIAGANNWIDDCFLTIGEARFYKLEYFGAVDAFEYVTKKYVKWDIHYDGFLWLIRTYNETSIFSKSEELITLLKDDRKFPKNRHAELYALSADYNIRREQWQAAIGNLTKAIVLLEPVGPLKEINVLKNSPLSKNKNVRARYIYVLAQLYEKMGDSKKASELFAQVVKMKPKYDMEFNARLNRARLYDFSDGKGDQIKAELLKMIKDFKNEDYRDQIYYTLALIELNQNNEPDGIAYLKKSIRVSTKNPPLKTKAYLKLADLYYDKTNYKMAKAYYDSVVPLIKKEYPDYELIVAKDKNLNDLIKNLTVISTEDSLQRIAKMDTASRNAFIDNLIAEAKEAERKKEEERQNALHNGTGGGGTSIPITSVTPASTQNNEAGSWYFYNSAAISFGTADFRKKWGDRKLEDNWRRLSKENSGFGDPTTNSDVQDTTKATVTASKDPKKKGSGPASSRDGYMRALPLTKDAVDRSNGKLLDAYYNVGMIYKEALMNNGRAASTFEEMISRFPDNKYLPTPYYFLYRIYLSMEDQEKADRNREIILSRYPNSALAEMLKHPESVSISHAREDSIKRFYNETYALYLGADYPEVVRRCEKADSIYGGSKLSPKFSYMKALSLGHTSDLKTYEYALTAVTIKYPKDEVRNQAMGMLDAIRRVTTGAAAAAKNDSLNPQAKKEKFFYKEDIPHYTVIVLKGKGLDISSLKTNLSNFNQQYFPALNLTITMYPISEEYQIIQIKEFPDKARSMTYYEFVKGDKEVFKEVPSSSAEVFTISNENFRAFFKEKTTDEYKEFFLNYYLKKNP